jgi:hypothetical protein
MKDSVIETMEGISTNMRDKTFNSSLNRGAFAKFMSFMSNVELKDMVRYIVYIKYIHNICMHVGDKRV